MNIGLFCSLPLLLLSVVQLSITFSEIYTACLCLYRSLITMQKTIIISSTMCSEIVNQCSPGCALKEDHLLQQILALPSTYPA